MLEFFHSVQSIDEAHTLYRRLAAELHPDRARDDGTAFRRMQSEYDTVKNYFVMRGYFERPAPQPPPPQVVCVPVQQPPPAGQSIDTVLDRIERAVRVGGAVVSGVRQLISLFPEEKEEGNEKME